MADVGGLMWLLELADDVESDLSVFHRVEEMQSMPSTRFVRLATRLPAYSGATAARLRLREAVRREQETAKASEPAAPARPMTQFRRGAPSMHWTRAAVKVEAS